MTPVSTKPKDNLVKNVNALIQIANNTPGQNMEEVDAFTDLLQLKIQECRYQDKYTVAAKGVEAIENLGSRKDTYALDSIRQTCGEVNTISSDKLTTTALLSGLAPTRIIQYGRVKQYVGFGWVNESPAYYQDYKTLPVVV